MMTTTNEDLENDDNEQIPENNNSLESDNSIGNLRNEAMLRKERLKQYRLRQFSNNSSHHELISSVSEADKLPKPIFRNYKPQSEELRDGQLPLEQPVDLNKQITTQLEAADAPVILKEVNLMNLAPRKPDWDLKRGVEKKLRKLERRTQRAIAELIRERLSQNQSNRIE